ncbi:YqzE-like protein [Salsuginibacillus halophilus]|uniref:YqzE-like protein n=1 Tax=Salsuginibacillus halophilus TaxID=517424 RepID=A0A2P8H7Z8_9BACI|nr:YqzE family protein [Salsuginibacillus halophilus]PSL42346.1 YqzE-like protein [Salsuginibacillus halophilus]
MTPNPLLKELAARFTRLLEKRPNRQAKRDKRLPRSYRWFGMIPLAVRTMRRKK